MLLSNRSKRCQRVRDEVSTVFIKLRRYTVEPLYNGHLRTEFSGRCKEVAVMERFSVRGSAVGTGKHGR